MQNKTFAKKSFRAVNFPRQKPPIFNIILGNMLKHLQKCFSVLLPRDARSASAVLLSYVVRPSFLRPSVRLSVRNADVPWVYRLN